MFVTCVVDQLFPQVGLAMADVLEKVGYEIDFPEAQTCCGQPAFNSGHWDEAREVARHFLDVFQEAEHLFRKEPDELERARAIGARVWEFSQFLLEVAKVEDVGARLDRIVTCHDSCHALRELKIKEGPRRLLSHVQGLTLREMDKAEECCGFGGTFSVKFADVSGSMAETKVESILRTGAEVVVSVDSSCLMQIQGALSRAGAPVKTMHLAEVLASQ